MNTCAIALTVAVDDQPVWTFGLVEFLASLDLFGNSWHLIFETGAVASVDMSLDLGRKRLSSIKDTETIIINGFRLIERFRFIDAIDDNLYHHRSFE